MVRSARTLHCPTMRGSHAENSLHRMLQSTTVAVNSKGRLLSALGQQDSLLCLCIHFLYIPAKTAGLHQSNQRFNIRYGLVARICRSHRVVRYQAPARPGFDSRCRKHSFCLLDGQSGAHFLLSGGLQLLCASELGTMKVIWNVRTA
jgi:hypothetical protein